jgi:hypothetical protein
MVLLSQLPDYQSLREKIKRLPDSTKIDVPTPRTLAKEVAAELVRRYAGTAHTKEKIIIASDGSAVLKSFEDGTPLSRALRSPSFKGYSSPELWREIVRLQKEKETELVITGLSTGLTNPEYILIRGTLERPDLVATDLELLRPSAETLAYYHGRDILLATSSSPAYRSLAEWPLMPTQILFNENWSLSYAQAQKYIRVFYGVKNDEAVDHILATIPPWTFPAFPQKRSIKLQEDACARIVANDFEIVLAE